MTANGARNSNPRPIPSGLIWESRNHSCAYDATLTILLNLWSVDSLRWSRDLASLGRLMGDFALGLQSVVQGSGSLEQARDEVRRQMNSENPEAFPYGPNLCSIDRVASMLFPTCRLNNIRTKLVMLSQIRDVPPVILLDINHPRLFFDRELGFDCNGSLIKMKLRGIVYGGQRHFTCRFIDAYEAVWFHDGITTGRRCLQQQGNMSNVDVMSLHQCGEKHAVPVIYAHIN
ncbi:hypothetical protein FB451DRAFT_1173088 [Mycena latifolia]|nr:hypothetical protein FB451DRAFT_1173088 [Mycena latifolia]